MIIKLKQIKLITFNLWWSIGIFGLFSIVMLATIFGISQRPQGNLIFSLKAHKNPIFPAFVLFSTVYLATLLEIISWFRYIIWMHIGNSELVVPLCK